MLGDSIGAISVNEAYDRSVTLTFNSGTNADIYSTLKSYFASGNRILLIYVPSTRGTYSGGYCYDYLSITAATLTITYEYLQSDGSLSSAIVSAGIVAMLNINAYNSAYSHKVVWTFGSHTATQTIAAGTASASYAIPLSWLDVIPSATSGAASVSLETLDTSEASLGAYSYGFTVIVPSSVVPSISSVAAVPVNDNSVLVGWGLYAYGNSKTKLTINSAAGAY